MDKRNKIAIAIGSVVFLASGIYLLSKPENDGIISDNKYQTIVQNDSKDNELDKNNSLSINDNSSSSDTSSNTGNANVLVSNNGKGDKTQTGDKNPANSGGSSNQNNSDYSTNISKPGTPNIPSKPSLPGNTDEPSNPGVPEEPNEPNNPEVPEEPNEPNNPGVPEEPNEPNNPEVPGEPNEPSNPEEPEIVVTDITITKDDLVDGVVTLSNKTYKNISIDSSVANGKVILDNIEVQEKLILEDGVQYQVKINNSKVPYVKVESNDIKRYRNISLNINKNISGPTLYLENVEEINKVDINGNVSIYGDSEISNLSLLNGILLLDEPEIVVTDITITKDDLVDGVVTLSNKTYKNISIDSSVANGKVILDNIEVQEKLILEDGVQYQVKINNSKVPYVKVESNDIKRYRNISLNINKNISGPTLYLENVEEINKVDINGNVSIYGDSEISNLSLLNGILLLDIPTKIMNIDENSIYADITINKKVNEINDGGNSTSIGINDNVDKVNLNGKKSSMYIKEGVTVGKATINGDSTKVMGNGTLTSVEINGDNVGVYTEIHKDNVLINESANNTFIGREDKYEISSITPKKQGTIEFTLNEKTSRALKLSDISIICYGGNLMTVFDVTTQDNKTYTLNTSYYKDNTYELYITLPNGNIISKEFNYSYNHPTASKVVLDRTNPTEAVLDVYGVDEGGYLYYKLVEKNNSRSNNSINTDYIKENGTKVFIKTEYNEIVISDLDESKEYDLYYVMEGYDGRTSPVYGPISLGKYEEKPESNGYKLDYVAEVESNRFVFTFNKPVKGDLKLDDFKIICPTESSLTTKGAKFIVSPDKKTYTIIVPDNYGHKDNKYLKLDDFKIICPTESSLTTKGAKFIVSPDKKTYTIIVPDNYGHKDNKYTVSINMPDGSIVEGSFRSHFNPPVISGENIDRYAKDKIKFEFNSDERGTLYYGIYEWNNSILAGDSTTPMAEDVLSGKIKRKDKIKFEFNSDERGTLYYGIYEWNNSILAGDSTTPMAEDVLSGKIKSTKVSLNSNYNELDIDLSGYSLTKNSRIWVLYVDYDGNYRNGFVDHYKIPEFTGNTEEDKSSLDITNIEVSKGSMGTLLKLTFNEDLLYTFGQDKIKLQSLSGGTLPGRIGMSVSFPSNKLNYASIELMGVTLSTGDYRITIETYDSKDNPVKIVKEFTVK